MTITLRPEYEKVVMQAIESDAYQNADEVIERALEVLRSEDGWLLNHRDNSRSCLVFPHPALFNPRRFAEKFNKL